MNPVKLSLVLAAFGLSGALAGETKGKPGESAFGMKRAERVAECAQCHPKEHKAWKAGPHADSYPHMLREAEKLLAKGDKIDYKKECLRCHAPVVNLYEYNLPVGFSDPEEIEVRIREHEKGDPEPKTGVDCIVCHSKGGRIVTSADYEPSAGLRRPEGFCDPIPSKTFSHVINCKPCHMDLGLDKNYLDKFNRAYKKGVANRSFPFVYCEQCHMDKDPSGEYNHYYYNAHAPRKKMKFYSNIFEKLQIAVESSDRKAELVLRWPEGFAPHLTSLPDILRVYVLGFKIKDESGKSVSETRVLFLYVPSEKDVDNIAEIIPKMREKFFPERLFLHEEMNNAVIRREIPGSLGHGEIEFSVTSKTYLLEGVPRFREDVKKRAVVYERTLAF